MCLMIFSNKGGPISTSGPTNCIFPSVATCCELDIALNLVSLATDLMVAFPVVNLATDLMVAFPANRAF